MKNIPNTTAALFTKFAESKNILKVNNGETSLKPESLDNIGRVHSEFLTWLHANHEDKALDVENYMRDEINFRKQQAALQTEEVEVCLDGGDGVGVDISTVELTGNAKADFSAMFGAAFKGISFEGGD